MKIEYLGQLFGIIGLICMVISVLCSNKQKILKFIKLKSVFYALQYLCLGAMSGCASMILGILRADLISRKEKNPKYAKYIFTFLILIYTVNSIVTYKSSVDILTIFGNACYITTLWFFKDIGIKIGTAFTVCIWMTYNIIVGAYAVVLSDAMVLTITILYIIKYFIKKRKEKNESIKSNSIA